MKKLAEIPIQDTSNSWVKVMTAPFPELDFVDQISVMPGLGDNKLAGRRAVSRLYSHPKSALLLSQAVITLSRRD